MGSSIALPSVIVPVTLSVGLISKVPVGLKTTLNLPLVPLALVLGVVILDSGVRLRVALFTCPTGSYLTTRPLRSISTLTAIGCLMLARFCQLPLRSRRNLRSRKPSCVASTVCPVVAGSPLVGDGVVVGEPDGVGCALVGDGTALGELWGVGGVPAGLVGLGATTGAGAVKFGLETWGDGRA